MNDQKIITDEQYKKLHKLLAKEEKQKNYQKRLAVKNQIYVEKAKAAGIEVTDEEINARIKNNTNVNVRNDVDNQHNNAQEDNV